jgi:crossover junction endodeoxyribonuclease RuvC
VEAERIIGIDPGTQVVGWGVVERGPDGIRYVASGVWRLGSSKRPISERLLILGNSLRAGLKEWQPTRMALESAFFGKNARSALRLGESRGVVLYAAGEAELPVLEIAPASVKLRVAGSGAATKEQVARLVSAQLNCGDFEAEDESDAVAVALCGLLDGRKDQKEDRIPRGARVQ